MDQNRSSQNQPGEPVIYKVEVTTGHGLLTGTFDLISIALVGTNGESPKMYLNQFGMTCCQGSGAEVDLPCDRDLGPLLLIRLQKEPYSCFPESSWYCDIVQVTSPQGEVFLFPCYQWIEGYCTVSYREGTAHIPSDDTHGLQRRHRQEEIQQRQRKYGWKEYIPEVPWCADIDTLATIEYNIEYSFPKTAAFFGRGSTALLEAKMKGFLNKPYSWEKLEDIRKIFWFYHTPVSEFVFKHWKDDTFFGYQFLNGINPIKIQKCTKIPENFPVTQEMVAGTLGKYTTLQEELKKGTIYLVDYKILENIPAILLNNHQQYIAAPLCLLHQKPSGEVLPLAIQLSQQPGPQSPIFLPTDEEWLWTLAKTWVRNSEFHTHEVIAHLLHGHLMAEVFSVATLRNLPMCHPLYKLLIPHLRYSIHINVLARTFLISQGGTFDKAIATGRQGLAVLLQKATDDLTYTQLCLPDDIEARGVGGLLNYYYRDDGLKIWEAIKSFVSGIVGLYYKSDSAVQGDVELQAWLAEIFAKGFLSKETSGIPSSIQSVPELIKYLTMVIFTCSAHHAAVNGGQFEMGAFMPNLPSSMRKPPPQAKAPLRLQDFLDTIPEMNVTSQVLSVLWVLQNEILDMKPLGCYDEQLFVEEAPKRLIGDFQERLKRITVAIDSRNKTLTLPYTYLYPPNIENSTTI
ncbi:polyunsaturated fatty acid lipoxygenase ALOX15B-like isoform X1 [Pantherophis guttatus]|uniref:Polyunsaturated fatty acid lipoxygenase ALOX15B-like isoform X1 n=2 Tax=Pantherophis guttatus TaxID=94885 RepID=A0ABM3YXM9_PANGU|nr:polyunsaturated fatty acid lipoxygenase ALOX15B-like isoform X1 [Pantherophis guttatus]